MTFDDDRIALNQSPPPIRRSPALSVGLPHPPLVRGRFVQRVGRFLTLVELEGQPVLAHLANSGRLDTVLIPGEAVWLARRAVPGRRTAYDLVLAEAPCGFVSVDARLPNALVARSIEHGVLSPFTGWRVLRREARLGRSRVDLLLGQGAARCWVEVKSVTLVVEGLGRFPDAPTARGARHLAELAAARAAGDHATIVFVVQREDVVAFAPHQTLDPAFARALRDAWHAGVKVLGYRCAVDLAGLRLQDELPVRLFTAPECGIHGA